MDKLIFIQECVAELYPFTAGELAFFKEELNFTYVSANRKIDWSFNLIKELEEHWNLELLDSNKAVFDKVTLGLIFPDKIELPKCSCYRRDDFCEDAQCSINARRLQYTSNLRLKDKITYFRIAILCDTQLLEKDLLFELYKNESSHLIEVLLDSSFNNS